MKRLGMLTEKTEAQRRHSICKQCEHYRKITDQCKKCNCFMIAKTKIKNSSCPVGKWGDNNSWGI